MLHVGLDLSRQRVDVCLISSEGELVEHFRAPSDRDGLYGLSRRVAVYDEPVRGVVESMNGARFVHDELIKYGWEVLVADAQRVKGLAPLACKTDKIDARVLAELSLRDLVPAIWLPDPQVRRERELARFRLHLVRHRSSLKNRLHSTLITFGKPCPISKHGPKYLRWALFEAALNACDHPLYRERYERTKKRLGRQRGPKVAQIELSRKLTEAIWHMLTRNQPFAPAGAPFRLTA